MEKLTREQGFIAGMRESLNILETLAQEVVNGRGKESE
jgi:hypothetical protein